MARRLGIPHNLEEIEVAPSASDETWAEVKRLYVESDETIQSIAEKCGVCLSTLFRRRAREGWPRRWQRRGRAVGATGPLAVSSDPARTARLTLEKRLYQVMILKLEKLEQRMNSGQAVTPADNEREAREIGTMIRGFEKVKEVGAGDGNSESVGIHPGLGIAADTGRMRQEIADRLERLHQRWKSEGGSGGAAG